jgi:DNA polymerase-1
MLAHYLINPDMRHDMSVLTETYLNYKPKTIESVIGKKGKDQLILNQIDLEKQTEYITEFADFTFQLKEIFVQDLEKYQLTKLYNEIEIPLLQVLAQMELEGIKLDATGSPTVRLNIRQ